MRFLRDNPLLLLGVAVIGFGAWVIGDQLVPKADDRSPIAMQSPPIVVHNSKMSAFEASGEVPAATAEAPRSPGLVTSDLVPQLRPGMSRSEVEALIGPPPANLVTPVTESNGRMTYHAAYLANLDAPASKPSDNLGRRTVPGPQPVVKSMISLEFDASRPGHPLVRVQYADPLF